MSFPPKWMQAIIGFGANIGRPYRQIDLALRALARTQEIVRSSSVFRTGPIGVVNQPDFLNFVALVESKDSARLFLSELLKLEGMLGRVRTVPDGPRSIDLDLLAYGDLVLDTPELTIPHPRMHERAFVLAPLVEIAPDWVHPVLKLTARELLERLPPGQRVEKLGPLDGAIDLTKPDRAATRSPE